MDSTDFDAQLALAVASADPLERLERIQGVRFWQLSEPQKSRAAAAHARAWSLAAEQVSTLDASRHDALWVFVDRWAPLRSHVELLLAVPTDETFTRALERGARHLALARHEFTPNWLWLSVRLATTPERRDRLLRLLRGAFGEVLSAARRQGELPNQVAFVHVAASLADLEDGGGGPALADAFAVASSSAAHFELNQAAGPIAIALAQVGFRRARRDLEAFVMRANDPAALHVMQVRYALWVLAKTPQAAADWLSNEPNGRSYAAAALADLGHVDSLRLLEARAQAEPDAVVREALLEACARLRRGQTSPSPSERMVRLFGVVSTTELVTGTTSDDVFAARAKRVAPAPSETDEG